MIDPLKVNAGAMLGRISFELEPQSQAAHRAVDGVRLDVIVVEEERDKGLEVAVMSWPRCATSSPRCFLGASEW
jgi:hypothetical protein